MGKRRVMKFRGRCQITKTYKKGNEIHVVMKCPGIKKIKNYTAQELLDMA